MLIRLGLGLELGLQLGVRVGVGFGLVTTVKKGVELLQDLVATETFNKAFQYEAINRLGCCSCSALDGLS